MATSRTISVKTTSTKDNYNTNNDMNEPNARHQQQEEGTNISDKKKEQHDEHITPTKIIITHKLKY